MDNGTIIYWPVRNVELFVQYKKYRKHINVFFSCKILLTSRNIFQTKTLHQATTDLYHWALRTSTKCSNFFRCFSLTITQKKKDKP